MEEELEKFTDPSDYFKKFKKTNVKKPKQTANDDSLVSVLSKGTPIFRGFNTGVGDSMFDEGVLWDQDISLRDKSFNKDLEDYRSNNQPWYAKTGAMGARIGAKILTETAKLPAYAVGAVDAVFAPENTGFETAFNNTWIKTVNENAEAFNNEYLPVYVKKAVAEGNLWDNITSIDFWAKEGADGIGFIASMMIPGAIFKSLGAGSKLMGATAKSMQLLKGEQMINNSVRTLAELGINANKFDIAGTAIANTYIESAAEAGGAMEGLDKQKDVIIQGYLKQNPNLSLEQAEQMFQEQKGRLGRDVFVSNIGILAIPNLVQSKMIWGKAINKLANASEKSVANTLIKSGKRIAGATASEGFLEEAGQSTVEHMFTEKAKRGDLKKGSLGFKDYNISELGNAYLDTISSVEGQKAMFLGAFLGGGMSAYQGYKQDINDYKTSDNLNQWLSGRNLNFNDILEEDTYLRDENGEIQYHPNNKPIQDPKKVFKRFQALQVTEGKNKLYEQAVNEGNYELADKLKTDAETQFLLSFARNGEQGIQLLRENLETTIQSEEIKNSDENKQAEKKVKNLISRAEKMQKQYQTYQDFSKVLIKLDNEEATPEQKTAFLNLLADNYVYKEGLRFEAKSKLDSLNKQKNELISYLGDNINIKTDEILDENAFDDILKYKYKEDPRLTILNEKIDKVNKEIQEIDKTINNDLWDSKEVNKTFNELLTQDKKIEEQTSTESEDEFNNIIKDLESLQSTDEVLQYVNNLDEEFKSNIVIREKAEDVFKDLNHKKLVADQQKDAQNFTTTSIIGSDNTPTTTTSADKTTTVKGLTTVQANEVAEVDNEGDIQETSPKEVVELDKNTDPVNSSKNQGAARVISTNQETGKPLEGLEDFVKYEKEPRDKTKDKVTFDLGDVFKNKDEITAKGIINSLIDESFFKQEDKIKNFQIKLLEDFLPIKIKFKNGEKEAYSFIDSMSHPNPDIVARETLPLRKAIVSALIDNKGSFEGIEGKIEKQFSGELKMAEQGSNILELDVFKDMTEDEKINYFKRNTVYVSNKGVTKHTYQDKEDTNSPLSARHRGEVFLKIPMINGKMFYLKLNVSRLSEEKANATFELLKIYSNLITDLKSTDEQVRLNAESFDYKQLEDSINDPEHQLHVLLPELNILKATDSTDNIDIERLINTVVFAQNTNAKTKLVIDEEGRLVLGELLAKLNEKVPSDISNFTYDAQTLNNLTDLQREAIIKYLIAKRHNVLITKDNTLTFSNDDYIKYLLNPEYPILTTNAVVNEPTFQGYSNIYLNQSVVNNNKSKPKEIPSEEIKSEDINYENPEDLLASLENQYGDDVVVNKSTTTSKPQQSEIEAKKADIERRREEELDNIHKDVLKNALIKNETPLPNEKDIDNQIESLKIENKEIISKLENPNLSEEDFDKLAEELDDKLLGIPIGFVLENGKIIFVKYKIHHGNSINDNYSNGSTDRIGKYEIGDIVQVNNGSTNLISKVTKVSKTGRIIEATVDGTIVIRNGIVLSANEVQKQKEINAKYDAELKALEGTTSNIVSASFTGQGTTLEIEIKGEKKDFLLTWNRNNTNPTLWGNKKEDGSYTTTDSFPSKEDIQKLVDKYIPSKLLNLINEWTNASKLPAEKVLDAQAIIETKINAELKALNKLEVENKNTFENKEFKIKEIIQSTSEEKLELHNERELLKEELERTKNLDLSFEEISKRNELQKRVRTLNSKLMGFKPESIINTVVETKTNSNLSYAEIFNNSTNQEQMLEEAINESGMLTENLTDFGVNDFVKMMEMLEKVKKTNEINKICSK